MTGKKSIYVFGIVVIVLLLAFAIYWTYLGTVTELPAIGMGLAVSKPVQFISLVVGTVVLFFVFRAMAKKS